MRLSGFRSKYICPLHSLENIPIPEIDDTNPPKVLVNCKEITHTGGDYLCCGKVPVRRSKCNLKDFPCCICEIPFAFYVRCPCCDSGNTYMFRRNSTGEILMCCEECYYVWQEGEEGHGLEINLYAHDESICDDVVLLGFLMKKNI